MKKSYIAHNRPSIGKLEKQAVGRMMASFQLVQGEEIKKFEDEFCGFVGLKKGHAVAVSSGSAALYLSLWVLKAQNQKVALPTYVCSALENAIRLIGAQPEFHDIEKDSCNIDIESLNGSSASITIVPHLYGIPCDIEKIKKMKIIEDCCQSLGAKIRGESTGLQGELGIFSFYATKLMTTLGHGGMIVSKKKDLINQIKDYIYFDQKNDGLPRFNFQMTEAQAAVGRVQLKRLPTFIKKREFIFEQYLKKNIPLLGTDLDLKRMQAVRYRAVWQNKKPLYWIKRLKEHQIKAIVPIEKKELLGKSEQFPNAVHLSQNSVSLPIYPSLSKQNLNQILKVIAS